jgi:signal transduction protein with GAF and PtsI domain
MLLGMGYDAVSVVPSLVAEVKYAVRETTHAETVQIAAQALAETTSEGVRRVLAQARERLHIRQVEARDSDEVLDGNNGDSKKRENN